MKPTWRVDRDPDGGIDDAAMDCGHLFVHLERMNDNALSLVIMAAGGKGLNLSISASGPVHITEL